MFLRELVDQGSQRGNTSGCGEEHLLLRLEVVLDLVAKEALDFRLPLAGIARGPSLLVLRRKRTLDAEAQCQGIVMLVRERDESRIALHESSAMAWGWCALSVLF
jgi:hypothetical protein